MVSSRVTQFFSSPKLSAALFALLCIVLVLWAGGSGGTQNSSGGDWGSREGAAIHSSLGRRKSLPEDGDFSGVFSLNQKKAKSPVEGRTIYVEHVAKRHDTGEDGVIAEMALSLGLKWLSKETSKCADVAWRLQRPIQLASGKADDPSEQKKLEQTFYNCPGQRTNSLPGWRNILGQKIEFSALLWRCVEEYGEDICDFAPPSYNFPGMYEQWRKASHSHPNAVWVMKDEGGYSSQGINVLTAKQIEENKKKDVSVQEYILYPYLYKDYKWDMRLWVVITSMDPLRIFVLRDGFPKIASTKYSSSKSSLGDPCMHITSPTKACDTSVIESMPCRSEDPKWKPNVRPYGGDYLEGAWDATVWPAIQKAITKTLMFGYRDGMRFLEKLKKKGLVTDGFLYAAPDVIVDAQAGKAYVEEVNLNGFLGAYGRVNGGPIKGREYVRDLMVLTGMKEYNRASYMSDFEDVWSEFCLINPMACTQDHRDHCLRMVDEYYAAQSTSFDRTYPPPQFDLPHDYSRLMSHFLVDGSNDSVQLAFYRFASQRNLLK